MSKLKDDLTHSLKLVETIFCLSFLFIKIVQSLTCQFVRWLCWRQRKLNLLSLHLTVYIHNLLCVFVLKALEMAIVFNLYDKILLSSTMGITAHN